MRQYIPVTYIPCSHYQHLLYVFCFFFALFWTYCQTINIKSHYLMRFFFSFFFCAPMHVPASNNGTCVLLLNIQFQYLFCFMHPFIYYCLAPKNYKIPRTGEGSNPKPPTSKNNAAATTVKNNMGFPVIKKLKIWEKI